MRAIYRGLRNVYRSKARTALVVVLLGLSTGVFITMAQAADRTGEVASRLEKTVATLIEVRAAGATGMGRGVEPLRGDVAEQIVDVPGIWSIDRYLYFRQVDNTPSHGSLCSEQACSRWPHSRCSRHPWDTAWACSLCGPRC